MKKWCLGLLALLVLSNFIVGCGGGGKWKPYLGMWTDEKLATRQMEIKENGREGFILTLYQNNFFGPGIKTNDFIAKPSGETLSVTVLGFELPVVLDKKANTVSFDGSRYRRQTPEDAKKLEELKNRK